MNASIKGMYNYYIKGNKKCNNIICCDDNTPLSDKEAKAYIIYCYNQGYESLYDCPDYKEAFNKNITVPESNIG